jgi:HEAT repeat protein
MEGAIASSPEGLKPAAFDAYLAAADTVCAGGRCEQAARMFERLSGEDAPRPVRSAAVRGLIVARGHPDGTTLAVKHLRSDDEALFAAALGVVQEVKGPELTAAYANELATLPVERRVRLIDALAGRGGAESLAAIRKAAGSSESPVRVAALRALAQVGDAEGVTELVSAATGEDAEAARAAQQGLVMFPGSTADEAVLGLMGSDKAAVRRLGIDLAAKRQVAGASAALANATRDKDEQTRVAAIRALGEVAPADEIGSVIAVLVNAKAGAEVEAAERAVAAVIARAEPREATVEPLLSGMKDAGAAGRCALLRLLATAGGP